jgi:hypothetical protein
MTELWHSIGRRVTAVAVAGRTAQQAAADSGADQAMTVDKVHVLMAEEADSVTDAIRSVHSPIRVGDVEVPQGLAPRPASRLDRPNTQQCDQAGEPTQLAQEGETPRRPAPVGLRTPVGRRP